MKKDKRDNYHAYRPTPLYMMLLCGIIVALIGFFLMLTDQSARGIIEPGRYTGKGGPVRLPGSATIIIGLGLCILPAYILVRRRRKK